MHTELCFVVNCVHAAPAARAVTLISQRKIWHDFVMFKFGFDGWNEQQEILGAERSTRYWYCQYQYKMKSGFDMSHLWKGVISHCEDRYDFLKIYLYIPYRQWVYVCRQYTRILTCLIMVGKTPTGFFFKLQYMPWDEHECGLLFID